jgi:hypothetical protein
VHALFGIGLLLFWATGAAVPETCKDELDKPCGAVAAGPRSVPKPGPSATTPDGAPYP